VVRFVIVAVFHTVPVPVQVIFPVPNAIVLVLELLETKSLVVSVKLFKSRVPLVNVVVIVVVSADPKVHPPPTPLNVTAPPNETPLVVIVLPVVVALNVVVPVYVRVKFVAWKVKLPLTVKPTVPAKVITPSSPEAVKLLQTGVTVAIVTVNMPVPTLELASKNTSSAAVGTDAPNAPPLVADQLFVLVPSQFPEPNTQ